MLDRNDEFSQGLKIHQCGCIIFSMVCQLIEICVSKSRTYYDTKSTIRVQSCWSTARNKH